MRNNKAKFYAGQVFILDGYKRIHMSPVVEFHHIDIYEDATKQRYYVPMFSRTGRVFTNYRQQGKLVACRSYNAAMKHIKRGLRGATATPS